MTRDELPEGVTITPGVIVTIEDLTVTPPLRAYGTSESEALAAFAYQSELRDRQDADARGPVVAQGVKAAVPADEPQTEADGSVPSDETPGQDAPTDNPI